MKLKFDQHTQQKILQDWWWHVVVQCVQAGCAGIKITITERSQKTEGLSQYPQASDITVWCTPKEAKLLDTGQIAVANGRLYFSSPKVQGRCGCGTSIAFEKKKIDMSMAKIHTLSQKLSTLPHIQNALKQKK